MTDKKTEFAEGHFAVIRALVRMRVRPYEDGTSLLEYASTARVACEECGLLPADGLNGQAVQHAEETGHRVAVESWNGAVYGPPRKEGA